MYQVMLVFVDLEAFFNHITYIARMLDDTLNVFLQIFPFTA